MQPQTTNTITAAIKNSKLELLHCGVPLATSTTHNHEDYSAVPAVFATFGRDPPRPSALTLIKALN